MLYAFQNLFTHEQIYFNDLQEFESILIRILTQNFVAVNWQRSLFCHVRYSHYVRLIIFKNFCANVVRRDSVRYQFTEPTFEQLHI